MLSPSGLVPRPPVVHSRRCCLGWRVQGPLVASSLAEGRRDPCRCFDSTRRLPGDKFFLSLPLLVSRLAADTRPSHTSSWDNISTLGWTTGNRSRGNNAHFPTNIQPEACAQRRLHSRLLLDGINGSAEPGSSLIHVRRLTMLEMIPGLAICEPDMHPKLGRPQVSMETKDHLV